MCEKSSMQTLDKKGSVCDYEEPVAIDEDVTSMKVSSLLRSIVKSCSYNLLGQSLMGNSE